MPSKSDEQETDESGLTSGLTMLAPATLDGIKGMGILQVVRGQAESTEHVSGTWHIPQGKSPPVTLSEADIGREVSYRGEVSDPLRTGRDEVEITVRITSVGTYEFTPHLGQDSEGEPRPLTIVNFQPVKELPSQK